MLYGPTKIKLIIDLPRAYWKSLKQETDQTTCTQGYNRKKKQQAFPKTSQSMRNTFTDIMFDYCSIQQQL